MMPFVVSELRSGYIVIRDEYDTYREALEEYMKAVQEVIDKRLGCVRLEMVEDTMFGKSYSAIHFFLYKDKLE